MKDAFRFSAVTALYVIEDCFETDETSNIVIHLVTLEFGFEFYSTRLFLKH